MTDKEINRAIEDDREANDELFIKDDNDKVFENLTPFLKTGEENNFENSELDLASNLSSSIELEADTKQTRRSKNSTQIKTINKNQPNHQI